MITANLLLSALLVLSSATFVSAPPAEQPKDPHAGHHHHDHAGPEDINGILEKTEEFSTLLGLLHQADLTDAIEDAGPYTLFAPTNDAFAKLPEATLERLAKPENLPELKKLLLSHVIKGKLLAKDLKSGELETLAGTKLKITVTPEKVTIGDAPVDHANIDASNGVIHALSAVVQ